MKRGQGSPETKQTGRTSKLIIKVGEESAFSLFGRSDQEEAEYERKGTAECLGSVR